MSLPTYTTTTSSTAPSKWDQLGSEYYNVNTDQVTTRLQLACAIEGNLYDSILGTTNKPDFYGPFWIGATSAVTIFTSSTLSRSLKTGLITAPYSSLLSALLTIYGYILGEGVGVWAVCRYAFALTGDDLKPGLLITVVGYSLALLPAAALVASVPWRLVQTVAVLCCGVLSSLFLYRNVGHVLARQPGMREEQRSVLMAVWLTCHASLFVLIISRYY